MEGFQHSNISNFTGDIKWIKPVGDLLIFNRGDGPMGAPPYPDDTPMYTSQRTLLQDTIIIFVTFLILQFNFIQLSSFSPTTVVFL